MATKAEIWEEVKTSFNQTELETLGISSRSSKAELENILGQAPKEKNPDFVQGMNLQPEPEPNPMQVEPELNEQIEKEKTETESITHEQPGGDEFDVLLGKIGAAEPGQPKDKKEKPLITKEKRKRKKGESSPDSFRIEGYILLLATDTIFPTLLAFINNMVDKKHKKITAADLQLAQKDFDKLEPLADQAADYMSVQLNPIAGFFLVSAFMYTNNIIMIKMTNETTK